MSEHADYPHHPGYLYDCPACEAHCYCKPGDTECVHCALDVGKLGAKVASYVSRFNR
jgi:hypothetical protein